MHLKPFLLERYLAKYEFTAKYSLASSDCESLTQRELIEKADPESKSLWDSLKLGYTESPGHPLLRSEVSKLYLGIKPHEILILPPAEGIFIALNTILEKGDHVIVAFPGYQSLYEDALRIGCEVTYWKAEEKNNWRFNPDFLTQNVKSNTKLLVFNFPHNPTGYLPTKEDFEQIIAFAQKHNLYVFSDEMYRFLEFEERLPAACEIYEKAISLFGMSKSFGMAGVRIGWLASKDQVLLKRMEELKDYTAICSSAPSEILSIMALRQKERIINANIKRIKRNLFLLDNFFQKNADKFNWVRPKGGTTAFPKILNGIDSFDFCEKVVKESGIMLLPSTVFDYDRSHFRIGFGRENLPEVLQKFEEYLQN